LEHGALNSHNGGCRQGEEEKSPDGRGLMDDARESNKSHCVLCDQPGSRLTDFRLTAGGGTSPVNIGRRDAQRFYGKNEKDAVVRKEHNSYMSI